MEIPSLGNVPKGCTSSTAHLRRLRIANLEQYLKFVEPNRATLYTDLRYLARYIVKFGYHVELPIAMTSFKKGIKLQNDLDIDLERIVALISKYDLTSEEDTDKKEQELEINKSLYNVAETFPQQFIDIAAGLSPGTFDERRFWFCANNGEYWLKHCKYHHDNNLLMQRREYPHRLLSDVLHVLLTPNDRKLIKVCALRATVRYSDHVMRLGTFWKSMKRMIKIVKEDKLGKSNKELKTRLRIRYGIEQAEHELKPIDIESFVEWWNLTGLRVA